MLKLRPIVFFGLKSKFLPHSNVGCRHLKSISCFSTFTKERHWFPTTCLKQVKSPPMRYTTSCRSHSSVQAQISQHPSIGDWTDDTLGDKKSTRSGIEPVEEINYYKKNGQTFGINDFSVVDEGKKLRIVWSDERISNYHAVWLRFNCDCNVCCDPASNMRAFTLHEMPLTSTIKSVQYREDGRLSVQFIEEDHCSTFGADWLRENCYSVDSLKEKREALKPEFLLEKSIPEISYSEVEKSDKSLYKWLKNINDYGLCLLKGVPAQIDMLKTVIQLIGPVQGSVYGEMYEVYVRDVPINLAYSSEGLQFHTDLPMYECPPGIQFLHCLKFDERVKGGETTFVDLIHVAEQFREEHPEEFRTLTRVPCPYDRIHDAREHAVHMSHRRPAILLNNQEEIITVKWSPPYHGPIAVEEEYIEPFYRAFQLFGRAIQSYRYRKALRLQPGDLIGFNNRRICHGRNGFEQMQGERHLQGGYVNIDDYKSKLMILHKKYDKSAPIRRVYNTDWS